LGLLGAGAAALVAARKRWGDEDVALYLDEKLGSREQIVTALGVSKTKSEAALHLRQSAAQALAETATKLPGPKLWDAPQLSGPFGAAAIVWLSLTPLPK